MTTVATVRADLLAEQDALDAIVAGLADEEWDLPTPSPGWTIGDTIGHLTYFDGAATQAITDPDSFTADARALFAAPERVDEVTLGRGRSPAERLQRWRDGRRALAEASAPLGDSTRIAWYGPSMGAKSFLTARLMECWAHGQDVVDALGVTRVPTDRLRHIAQLGYITRGWSYVNRGREAPPGDVRVELVAPSGDAWVWGPDDAADAVRGPALDFCLVVTQRRHVDDTGLEVTGSLAREWMELAQAFAGPPSDGRAPTTGS